MSEKRESPKAEEIETAFEKQQDRLSMHGLDRRTLCL